MQLFRISQNLFIWQYSLQPEEKGFKTGARGSGKVEGTSVEKAESGSNYEKYKVNNTIITNFVNRFVNPLIVPNVYLIDS